MATAKKLPSGSWRCLVYSHTERIFDTKSGTWKDKRIYESFTSDDPSRRGKADAERQAAEFQQDRDTNVSRKRQKNGNILLKDAMKKYEDADVLFIVFVDSFRCFDSFVEIMHVDGRRNSNAAANAYDMILIHGKGCAKRP